MHEWNRHQLVLFSDHQHFGLLYCFFEGLAEMGDCQLSRRRSTRTHGVQTIDIQHLSLPIAVLKSHNFQRWRMISPFIPQISFPSFSKYVFQRSSKPSLRLITSTMVVPLIQRPYHMWQVLQCALLWQASTECTESIYSFNALSRFSEHGCTCWLAGAPL